MQQHASHIAAGAVLEQRVDGYWRPVSFYSKVFRGPELRYSTYDRELFAIKLSIVHFRHIVEGLSPALFHVATDHHPLTTGINFGPTGGSKMQTDRIARTWAIISELTTNIRYLPGKENAVANALSHNQPALVNSIMLNLLPLIHEEQERSNMFHDPFAQRPTHWVQAH